MRLHFFDGCTPVDRTAPLVDCYGKRLEIALLAGREPGDAPD